MARACATQRLGGDVAAHHLGARARQRGHEMTLAATHVQHTRGATGTLPRRRDVFEQEGFAQARVGRREPFGDALPQTFVVGACRHRVARLAGELVARPTQAMSAPIVLVAGALRARAAPTENANIGNSVGDSLPTYTRGGGTDYVLGQCAWVGQTSERLAV